jgi:flagellar protein FlgJ
MDRIRWQSVIPPDSRIGDPSQPGPGLESARQFEALLIGQLLRQAREASAGSWLGDSEDSTNSPLLELAEEQFAQLLARKGAFGLSEVIGRALEQSGQQPDSPAGNAVQALRHRSATRVTE